MKVPSSPDKRYLSGADWCVAALSEGTILTTGRRCLFQVAVFLEGAPDGERLAAAFRDFCSRFPVLWGRAARCWCLAPYWKQPAAAYPGRPVHVGRSELPAGVGQPEVLRHIERLVNGHAARAGWTTALDIVQVGADAGILVFSFDHCLFDAVGGETFIELFFRQINGEAGEAEFPPRRQTAAAQLDHWRQKFASGRKVNRMMRRLAAGETAWLPLPRDAQQRPFRFRVATFDVQESRRIQARAFQVAGYLMFTPYVLATAAAVLRPYFSRCSASATHFVVSVSTDKPKTAVRASHLFFNDLSFLYFQFPVAAAVDRNALAGVVRDQLIFQAKEGVPAAVEEANLLMRILSARMLWRFFMRLYRSRLSSFGFTCLGESALRTRAVLGCRVRDQIHFPVIPAPPGFGLILSQSEGVYHVVLSYLEGILPEAEVDAILQDFRARLLE
jgi:hypothetical protein